MWVVLEPLLGMQLLGQPCLVQGQQSGPVGDQGVDGVLSEVASTRRQPHPCGYQPVAAVVVLVDFWLESCSPCHPSYYHTTTCSCRHSPMKPSSRSCSSNLANPPFFLAKTALLHLASSKSRAKIPVGRTPARIRFGNSPTTPKIVLAMFPANDFLSTIPSDLPTSLTWCPQSTYSAILPRSPTTFFRSRPTTLLRSREWGFEGLHWIQASHPRSLLRNLSKNPSTRSSKHPPSRTKPHHCRGSLSKNASKNRSTKLPLSYSTSDCGSWSCSCCFCLDLRSLPSCCALDASEVEPLVVLLLLVLAAVVAVDAEVQNATVATMGAMLPAPPLPHHGQGDSGIPMKASGVRPDPWRGGRSWPLKQLWTVLA
mmetsp:Transcript_81455/g.170354  ORF Transcript_81455/g.170354 Transcript_81455/m.170354 type:complete len:369 (+) Transcript_81455:1067-2173(+)